MLKINEIFHSIQGESSRAGHPSVFVRTTGCPLRCHYCDTTYAYKKGSLFSIEDIIKKITSFKTKFVCITGGEPLVQKDIYPLMEKLCNLNFKLSLETSGAIVCDKVDKRVKKVIDVKTPDSSEGSSFKLDNLNYSNLNTEFKFVICSEKDFHWSEKFCYDHDLFNKTNVFYSPCFGKIKEKWLAEKILKAQSPARLQLQLHKYIWGADAIGV